MWLAFVIVLWFVFVPVLFLYLPLIVVAIKILPETISLAFSLMFNSFRTASEFEGSILTDFAELRLQSWPLIRQFLTPSYEDYMYQAAAILFSIGLPVLPALLLVRYLIKKF